MAPTLNEAREVIGDNNSVVSNVWERNHIILNSTQDDSRIVKAEEPSISTNSSSSELQLHIKEEPVAATTQPIEAKVMDRYFTDSELDEKRRFEEQKRQLEERAERLRNLSFNVKSSEQLSTDDIEHVPAYLRKEMNLEKGVNSADKFYSGYTVGMKNEGQDDNQVSINTINTFLDGKKPD
jgi:cell division protein FtsZ